MVQGGNESLLRGINFAALAMDGVDRKQLKEGCRALEEVGAMVRIVSAENDMQPAREQDHPASEVQGQLNFDEADPQDFAAVFIPGGREHAERLRRHAGARQFIAAIAEDAKPVAASGEGVALLIDAHLVQDRTVAAPAGFREAIRQAGGKYSDKSVEADGMLVSSSGPEHFDELVQTMLTVTASHVRASVKGTQDERPIVGPSS